MENTWCKHLVGLLLINKMRNLANDISHKRSVLTVKIFGATTIQHFLIKGKECVRSSVAQKGAVVFVVNSSSGNISERLICLGKTYYK